MNEDPYRMRKPCPDCECEFGVVREVGFQDTVRCRDCGKFQYNAPRLETGKPQRHIKTRENIKLAIRSLVMVRAGGACELCHCVAPLTVGHLLSVDAGRSEDLTDDELNCEENLAAMCDACNSGISSNPVPLRVAVAIIVTRNKLLGAKAGARKVG